MTAPARTLVRTLVCSPYSASTLQEREANIAYAWACLRDSARNHGEAPFASHLLYTQSPGGRWAEEKDGTTDEKHWISREDGLACEAAWRAAAERIVFYTDRGWSRGMIQAKDAAIHSNTPYVIRSLPAEALPKTDPGQTMVLVRPDAHASASAGAKRYRVVDETGSHLRGEYGGLTERQVLGLCEFLGPGGADVSINDPDIELQLKARKLRNEGHDIYLQIAAQTRNEGHDSFINKQ